MCEKIVWKAEIKFEGTVDEFNQLSDSLATLPVDFSIHEWEDRLHHPPGCTRLEGLLSEDILQGLAKDMPRMQVKYIDDIYGGIRTPHFHLAGDVVLLDRARFKTLVGQVAQELAETRAAIMEDYIEVMDPISRLDPTPQA